MTHSRRTQRQDAAVHLRWCCSHIGIYGTLDIGYSPLRFAALITGHHFSTSAFCKAPSASGVCWSRGGMSAANSEYRARRAGSAEASTTAALSLAIMSFGVPFGAQSELQLN